MAKSVRISDAFYALTQQEARLGDRSVAQKVEDWAKPGLAAASQGTHSPVTSSQSASAMTREMDALDMLSGKCSADYLHFIRRAIARKSKAVFPSRYRKSLRMSRESKVYPPPS